MRVCRALTEHIARARQLYAYVLMDSDREFVDAIIAEIEDRRSQLANGRTLASEVFKERTMRSRGRASRRENRVPGWSRLRNGGGNFARKRSTDE